MKGIVLRAVWALFLAVAAIGRLMPAPAGSGDFTISTLLGSQTRTERLDVSLSWDEYWQQVEDAYQVIHSVEQKSLDDTRLRLEDMALQWEALTMVVFADGRSMTVDHSHLVSLLRDPDPDLARIEHMLAALLEERKNFTPGEVHGEDKEVLIRILAQPEFQWEEQVVTEPNALIKLWQWIQKQLGWVNRTLLGFDGANYVLATGAVLLLVGGLLFLFRNLLLSFVTESRIAPHAQAGDEVLTADTALKQAHSLSRGGDYRSAVRYLYLSALLLLEERGFVSHDRTKTNREYLNSVNHQPELEIPLKNVVDVFDRVWYGYQPMTDQDYQWYERQVGKLRQQRQAAQPKNGSQ